MERKRLVFCGFSVDNLLVVVAMLGGIFAGIYEGGRIEATLESGIHEEHTIREAEVAGIGTQIAALQKAIEDTHNDIRELRSYIMVDHQYGMRTR